MSDPTALKASLTQLCAGLVYISETDADIRIADLGPLEPGVTAIAKAVGSTDGSGEVSSVEEFFSPLIAVYDDATPERAARAKRFLELRSWLEENLRDLAVYKFGGVRKQVYVLGRAEDGRLIGISTEAVTTG